MKTYIVTIDAFRIMTELTADEAAALMADGVTIEEV